MARVAYGQRQSTAPTSRARSGHAWLLSPSACGAEADPGKLQPVEKMLLLLESRRRSIACVSFVVSCSSVALELESLVTQWESRQWGCSSVCTGRLDQGAVCKTPT